MKKPSRPGRWKRRLLRLTAGAAILYVVACTGLYFLQEWLSFHPIPLAADYRFQFKEPFTEISIPSTDGVQLNALHFTTPDPKGLVVHFHGNSANIDITSRLRNDYLNRGYEFLAVDYRGYGKSNGSITQQGLFDDAEATWKYALTQFPADSLVVLGVSLGTGPAIHLASKQPVKKLFLIAPYAGIDLLGEARYPIFPIHWLIKNPFPSRLYAPEVKAEVTLFHGDKDETIPFEHSMMLKDVFTHAKKVTLHEYPEADHNNVPAQHAFQSDLDAALR
jgi:alpha-beta hydrolase superfamily lysophospholipase